MATFSVVPTLGWARQCDLCGHLSQIMDDPRAAEAHLHNGSACRSCEPEQAAAESRAVIESAQRMANEIMEHMNAFSKDIDSRD